MVKKRNKLLYLLPKKGQWLSPPQKNLLLFIQILCLPLMQIRWLYISMWYIVRTRYFHPLIDILFKISAAAYLAIFHLNTEVGYLIKEVV